jgi:hypothetical protein
MGYSESASLEGNCYRVSLKICVVIKMEYVALSWKLLLVES